MLQNDRERNPTAEVTQRQDSTSVSNGSIVRPADWMFLQPNVLDEMHDAVIVTDMEGFITGCNRAAHAIYGYSAEELIGQHIKLLYAEEDLDILADVRAKVSDTGTFRGELRNITRSGLSIYIHLAIALLKGPEGQPAGIIGFSVDVTGQKLGNLAIKRGDAAEQGKLRAEAESRALLKAKQELETCNDRLETILSCMTDGLVVFDRDWRFTFVNAQAARILGRPAEKLLGRILWEIFPGADHSRLFQGMLRAISIGQPLHFDEFYPEPLNKYLDCYVYPTAEGVSVYFRDISERQQYVDAVLESDSRARLGMQVASLALADIDYNTGLNHLSAEAAQLFGLGDFAIAVPRQVVHATFHPEDRAELEKRITSCLDPAGTGWFAMDHRVVWPNRQIRWLRVRKQVFFTGEGIHARPERAMLAAFDVTAEKISTQLVRESESRIQLGMQVAALAIADIDYQTGIVHLSAEAARIFGLGDSTMNVSRSVIHNTFHPDDRDELEKRIKACLDPRGFGWFSMDHRITWPDGQVRWLRVRKQVYFTGSGAERKPQRAMLAALDTTTERTALDLVRDSEQRFRTLAESLPELIWETDGNGVKLYANHRYLDYAGSNSIKMIDQQWLSLIHPDDRELSSQRWEQSLRTGDPYLAEYRLRRTDGQYRHFLARALPVRNDDGDIERWIGSSTDIHEQKIAEEALRRSEMVVAAGKLAASVAHEINNPLTSVINLLFLLGQNPALDPDSRAYLTTAQEELARVTEVTTQSLRFHKQSTLAESTRIDDLLDSLLRFKQRVISASGIDIVREFRPVDPITCRAGDLRQALANILSNALDAAPLRSRIRIRVRHSPDWKDRTRKGLRITFADAGPGIPTDNLHRVFQAFYSTKGITSTGLGLWIAQDLITRCKGTISISSSTAPAHHGTVVSIFLPID